MILLSKKHLISFVAVTKRELKDNNTRLQKYLKNNCEMTLMQYISDIQNILENHKYNRNS